MFNMSDFCSVSVGDPFRGPHGQQPFNAFGPGPNMRHPQIGGNADMHGPMMPPNVSMMPNNMHYDQGSGSGMMPSNNMMPNNNMGPMGPGNNMSNHMMSGNPGNMNMGNQMGGGQSMMGPNNVPVSTSGGPPSRPMSNSDSVSVQNPFADTPPPILSQYQRPNMGQQIPPYSGGMQQSSTTMASSFGNYNRSMPSYQGNASQPSNFTEGMNRMSGPNSTSDSSSPGHFNQQQFGNRVGPNMGGQPFNQQQSSQQGPMSSGETTQSQQQQQQSGERWV
jgi:hypothetical protein